MRAVLSEAQSELFPDQTPWPEGLRYAEGLLSQREEHELIASIAELPLVPAEYKDHLARRRVAHFGSRYDFAAGELLPAPAIPPLLQPLRDRVAAWAGVPAEQFGDALIACYEPGAGLGWHRDVPDFECVAGVSLAGHARLRLRPYGRGSGTPRHQLELPLAPRSAYLLSGSARWGWQHSLPAVVELRYSVTFRTRRLR